MDLTHFGPDVPCTRAHVVTFLWRAQDQPAAGTANPFVDVPTGAYYTDAVLWAVKEKITNGMDARHFAPDSTCIRAQIVTFLYRALADRLPPAPPPVGDLRMACGGEAYTNTQLFGENIAYLISGHTMTYVEALSSDGSAANLAALQSGKAQLCLCRADAASYAWHGVRGDTGVAAYQDFSVLAAVNEDPIEIITLDDSIQTVDDLRGKTVAIGEKGSLLYYNALDILGAYGLTEADITPVYLPDTDAVYAVKNGELDTAFICRTAAFWSRARSCMISVTAMSRWTRRTLRRSSRKSPITGRIPSRWKTATARPRFTLPSPSAHCSSRETMWRTPTSETFSPRSATDLPCSRSWI